MSKAQLFDDIPIDRLLGRLVLFTITDEKIRRDDVVTWFEDLALDEALLPMQNKAVDAFKKATSATKTTYPMSRDRVGILMCRDVSSSPDYIRRQITREVKDGSKKRLSYEEACTVIFSRAKNGDQTTARLETRLNPARLEDEELPFVRAEMREIRERYESHLEYLDSQKVRYMVRDYLKKLNAIEIKGGVYFVHVSRDDELNRLSDLVNRFGGDCMMHMIPMVDREADRAFVVRKFEREAAETLTNLTKEINEIVGSGNPVAPSTFARLKSKFDEVVGNAEEHVLTLQISQESTTASAEVAQNALAELADRMVSDD